jgi:chitodextrinase
VKWIQSRTDIVKKSLAIFVVLLVSVVGVKLLMASQAATGATLSMTSTSTSVAPGSTVSVTIREDSGTDPVNSVQASINYDAAQLQYVSMTEGTAFPTVAATSTNTPGVIRVARASQGSPATGTNNIVTLNFKVLASSGTSSLNFDRASSFVVRSTDSADILATVSGITFTVAGSTGTSGSTLSMTPASGSYAKDATVSVTIKSTSAASLTTVQAAINYPASQLQYVSTTEGGVFTTAQRTNTGTAGLVDIIRSVPGGNAGVTGTNNVVTLNFKVIGTTGSAALTYAAASALFDNSGSGTNVLDRTNSAGASFTVTSTAPPTNGNATLSMTPSSGSYAQNSTVSVVVKADSAASLTTVQAAINYPASQLQYVSTTEGGVFTTAQRTNSTNPGVIDIIRSVPGGSAGVSGSNTVVTINFKVIGASGSAALTYNTAAAIFDASGTGVNILNRTASTGATYTVTSTTNPPAPTPPPPSPVPAPTATLSMTPGSGSYAKDSTVSVTIKANSSAPMTTVQAAINYPASQLMYMSTTEGGVFTTAARTNTATAGLVDIIRGVPGGSAGVTGTQNVVTINFKVIGSSGSAALSYATTSAVYDASGTGTNILDRAGSSVGSYAITSTTPVTGNAVMSLNPASGTAAVGSTVNITVRENSALTPVNAVQSSVQFDPAKLQYTGIVEGGIFTTVAATDTSTPGKIRLARSVQPGALGVSGDNPIATLSFKVLASSGSTSLSVNQTESFVVSGTTNTDILGTVAGSTYSLTSTAPTGNATFSMTPSTGTFAKDAMVSVIIKANSPSALTTVQAAINYPASQLQYVSTAEGGVFTTAQRTNTSTPGTIDIIRSIPGGNDGVSGTNPVVTLNFRVIGTSGSAPLTYATASALYDDSGTGNNILDRNNSTAANYTISTASSTCTTNPTTPGTPARSASTYTTITLGWNASTAGSNCTLSGYHVFRNGTLVGDVTSGNTTFTDTGLNSGTSYNYTVQAFDTANHVSPISPAASLSSRVDDMAPTTPSGITAAAPNAVSVNLAWNPSTDFPNPGGVGVAGYRIYRNNAVTPTYTVTNGTSFTDSNVTPGTTYTYTVNAYDQLGNESSPSSIVSARTADVTPNCTTNPSAPSSLSAGAVSLSTITMSWSPSTAGSGCTLSTYRIFRGATLVGTTSSTTFQDSGLQADTTYSYTVRAVDTLGHEGPASNTLNARTAAQTPNCSTNPTAPGSLTSGAVSLSTANMTWLPSTAGGGCSLSGYRIYRSGTLVGTSTDINFQDAGLQPNTNYTYVVRAYDNLGHESANSNQISIRTASGTVTCTGTPTAPSSLTAGVIGQTSLDMSWSGSSASNGCTLAGYKVYRAGIFIGTANTTNFQDTGLNPNTNYTYTVRAYDTSGHESADSNILTARTAALPTSSCTGNPSAPSGLAVNSVTANTVEMAWGPSGAASNCSLAGYRIYRSNILVGTSITTNFQDVGLTPDTAYAYTVKAFDTLGHESAASNVLSTRTSVLVSVCGGNPSTPTGLTGGALGLTTLDLSWTASNPANACTLAGYKIYRNAVFVGSSLTPNFQDTGLQTNTSYTYTVEAYDTNGNVSALSTPRTLTTATDTVAPVAPATVTAVAVSAGQVNLTWVGATDNVGVTNYRIYRNGSQIATSVGTARSFSDTQVVANTNYTYAVSAIDAAGNVSAQTTATPNPVRTPTTADTSAPTVPSNLRVLAVSTTSASIAWNASTDNVGIAGYHVYRAGIYIGDSVTTGYSDTGLTPDTAYSYTVKAFDVAGNTSAATSALSVRTIALPSCIVADLNCDRVVDIFDLSIMMSHWNEINVPVIFGDIDQDGKVNVFDLSTLLSHYGDRA